MLNEPITRASGRRGFCESLPAPFRVEKVGESSREEGLNEALLAVAPVNSAGVLQLERGRGSERTGGTPGSIFGELTKQPPKGSRLGPSQSLNREIFAVTSA